MVNKKESHVNTRLRTDHHKLIIPPISKDCSNIFLECSFIYAAPCEWNKLGECIRRSNVDCFRKSVEQFYLLNNMDADCKRKCIYYCYLCCNHF